MKIIRTFFQIILLVGLALAGQAQENNWTQLSFPDNAGYSGITFNTDNAGYYCEQTNTVPICNATRFFKFDPATQIWSAGPNLPTTCPMYGFGIGTRAYVGFFSGAMYYYDPSVDNNWHALNNIPMPVCAALNNTISNFAVAINGKGYLVANASYNTNNNTCTSGAYAMYVWEYNPASDSWTVKANLPNANPNYLRGEMAIFKIGQKLYTGMGYDDSGTDYTDFWEFNPATNAWTARANFPGGSRYAPMGFEFCNKGYLAGGLFSDNSVWCYDPQLNAWNKISNTMQNANTGITYSLQYGTTFTVGEKAYIAHINSVDGTMLQYTPVAEFKTETITGAPFCPGDTIQVPYTICGGTLNSGNIFTAQLSANGGSFASPVTIGTLTSNASSGSITCILPTTVSGNAYRIRVISSSPSRTSTDNGVNIIIKQAPSVSASAPIICYVTDAPFAVTNGSPSGGTYSGTGMINPTTFSPAVAGIGTHTLTYTFNHCSATAQVKVVVLDCSVSGGSWLQKTDFPLGIRENATGVIGNKGYVTTGVYAATPTNDGYLNDLWEYDFITNNWTNKNSPFPGSGRYGATSFVIGNKLYVGGGGVYGSTDFYAWDQTTNSWGPIAPLPEPLTYSVGFTINGYGYVAVGNNTTPLNVTVYPKHLYRYNPANNTWTRMADYPGVGRINASSFVINNKAYVGNGIQSPISDYKDFYCYDPATDSWSAIADFPNKRHWAISGTRNNKGYVGMGTSENPLTYYTDGYEYDPGSNSWTKQINFPSYPRVRSSSFTISNKIFLIGGTMNGMYQHVWQLGDCDPTIMNFPDQSVYCAGLFTYIPSPSKGTFNTANVFTAQLSDANGNFTSPVTIGTAPYTSLYNMSIGIPSNTPPGTGYRIRIISSDPAVIGPDNGFDITIAACTITTHPVSPLSFCAGSPVNITFTTSPGFSQQGNTNYIVEISNASGVFAPGTYLGSTTAIGSLTKTISAQIPVSMASGTGYRIRVKVTGVTDGIDNGADISIDHNCIGLAFDGSNDYVTIPHNAAYNFGSGDFTMEGWLKLNSTQMFATPTILGKRTSTSNGFVLILTDGGTKLRFYANNTSYVSSSFTSITDNACHHFAVTRLGNVVSFYIDGVLKGTATAVSTITGNNSLLYIGVDPFMMSNNLTGNINEIRIWNVARTESQISNGRSANYSGGGANLVGVWNFKEINSQTVTDGTATGNHGNLGSTTGADINDPVRNGSYCYQYDKTGILEEENTLQIFPNPFSQEILIKNNSADEGYLYEIISMDGAIISSGSADKDHTRISGEAIPSGIYQLRLVKNSGEVQIFKIVKL